ncbi:DUF378 domain-containing protein [Zymobacter palmae]|uniref:Uncharacterized conserved protein n=1 Tax=Zymobacter palmae TaxID=33074 RepID=A0A348HDT3_9GAMM|nr:DUF378 domain-containing protein [Zymobacter palmae]BBG29785.1 uncharacterized conserved protein [Zymobacter palmae]
MKRAAVIAQILLIAGGINWLLIGLIRLNLIDALFGPGTFAARLIYVMIGLSALYAISFIPRLSWP